MASNMLWDLCPDTFDHGSTFGLRRLFLLSNSLGCYLPKVVQDIIHPGILMDAQPTGRHDWDTMLSKESSFLLVRDRRDSE